MTLTVRLHRTLEQALEDYCREHHVTKTYVVQECLAQYLVGPAAHATRGAAVARPTSANYLAFLRAGLISSTRLDGQSATKEVVRQRAMSRLARKK